MRQRNKPAATEVFALVPAKEIVPLPGLSLPIYVSRGPTVAAIEHALAKSQSVVLSLDANTDVEHFQEDKISKVGALASIVYNLRLSNGDLKVRLRVEERVKILSLVGHGSFYLAEVERWHKSKHAKTDPTQEKYLSEVKEKIAALAQFDQTIEEFIQGAKELDDPGELADLAATLLPLQLSEAQAVLSELDPWKRLHLIGDFLNSHLDTLSIRERVITRAQDELGKASHQELLREQIRQLQAELGEEAFADELSDLEKQLKKMNMPPHAKKEAEKQIRRLQQLHPDTSEAALARTYIDWIVDLPWQKKTRDRIDLKRAREILDQDHYGLEKPKERILDFLGVGKLRSQLKGPILLLVGPPGVGKTSLGRSIARALGRKFVRTSLGGLRDEAELRGHRRTYVGALPGRIIQGLKTAGAKNPVFMLDELDKIGNDFRGDPASVLLEILDPEQNKAFEDHYLNIPFDLSEVMFIGTANITDTIPPALIDRMEIIEIAGYTTEEKLHIAKRYLIPRSKEESGLKNINTIIPERTLVYLIDMYTRESGVRELGRCISTIHQKVARQIAEGGEPPRFVTAKMVEKFLGIIRFLPDKQLSKDEVGIVTGLAWTPVGGEVLTVEVSLTPGKGELSLTGQLGEVMRESAMAALTYVLSSARTLKIDPDFHEKSNLHIHVPQGAIPKDGPSAGLAMAIALISLLTNRPVSRTVAMTGEITLRGNIIAIGGLREKALAALRLGSKTVIFPKENEPELQEFPKYLLDKIRFVPVENINQAVEAALLAAVKEAAKSKRKAATSRRQKRHSEREKRVSLR